MSSNWICHQLGQDTNTSLFTSRAAIWIGVRMKEILINPLGWASHGWSWNTQPASGTSWSSKFVLHSSSSRAPGSVLHMFMQSHQLVWPSGKKKKSYWLITEMKNTMHTTGTGLFFADPAGPIQWEAVNQSQRSCCGQLPRVVCDWFIVCSDITVWLLTYVDINNSWVRIWTTTGFLSFPWLLSW